MSNKFKPKKRIIPKDFSTELGKEHWNNFVDDVTELWDEGKQAQEIVDLMGIKGLSPGWIYQHRNEMGLTPRRIIKVRYPHKPGILGRYRIPPSELGEKPTPEKWLERLNVVFPTFKNIKGTEYLENNKYRALMWMYYNSPLRRSEILELIYDDIKINEKKRQLILHHLIRKKKDKDNPINAPFIFDLDNDPGADEIYNYMIDGMKRYKDSSKRIFANISGWMAWAAMKKLFKDYYPHFMRHSYVTGGMDTNTPIIDLLTEVSVDASTLKKDRKSVV